LPIVAIADWRFAIADWRDTERCYGRRSKQCQVELESQSAIGNQQSAMPYPPVFFM
jgi:hypothetical protein